MAAENSSRPAGAALWDLPTRFVHWALVVALLVSWFTAGEQMQIHRWSGYVVIALLVFRLWWGIAGGSTARFASFVKGPQATAAYLKTLGSRQPVESAGHNPLGAWSVVAMLLAMLVQVGLGLFASDIDGLESGPLSHLVDFDTGRVMADLHETTFRILQGLVALHLIALGYYWGWKRQNLIGAMVTGKRMLSGGVAGLRFAPAWRVLAGLLLAVAVAWFIAKGGRL
jgi:cytochrome b